MTREIKFKVLVEDEETHEIYVKYFTLEEIISWHCEEWTRDLPNIINERYLEYTWLKDKNWKEVYEGDIIMFWDRMNPNSHTERKNEVVLWNKKELKYDWLYPTLYPRRMFEIIWNIYENPELLENNQ